MRRRGRLPDARLYPVLNLPKDMDFECTQCGRCCRDPWEIRVDAASAEKLLARPWPGLPVEVPFKRRLDVVDDLGYTVERKPCGSCVFLEEGNLCRIHREIGLVEKPRVCQQFPFLFAQHPGGVTVGLSHYCPGVRRVEGATAPPLEAKRGELERLLANALRLVKVGDTVLLDDGVPLPWADYELLEGFLLELLAAPGVDVREAITALSIASLMLGDLLRTKPGATSEFVAGWRRMGIGRILAMGAKQRAKPRTGRLLLRQFLSLVDATASGSRLGAFGGAWAFAKELLGVGSVKCVPLEARVSVLGVRAVELPWEEAEPLRRYAEHAIFRRRLLPVLGVRVGLALLALHVGAMRYVARASALVAGRARATGEDLARGVQLVEKFYAAHSSLPVAFESGAARKVFRRVADRPRYLWAVLGG